MPKKPPADIVALRTIDGRAFHSVAFDEGLSGHHSLLDHGCLLQILVCLDNALGPAIAPPAEKDPEDPPFGTFATRLEILRNCAEFLDVVQASDKDVVERPAIEAVALTRTGADGLRRERTAPPLRLERQPNRGVAAMPTTDSARRASRNENAGTRQKLCSRCSVRLARHRVNGDRLCCHCYVGRGYPPATWHPDCVAAAAAFRKPQK
jgi:hypothetical protein